MKKFISVFLIVVISLCSFGASAASVPAFMENRYNNYTADYTMSMKINNAGEIADFLRELEMPEQVNNFVNVKALIESLLDVSSVVNVQAEISDDFRKMSASITAESSQNVVFNRNYESSYLAKMGIWTKIDVDKKEFVIIYATPLNEKYAIIDFSKDAQKEVNETLFEMYDKMLNREFMDKYTKRILEISMEHAEVSVKGKKATVHYDNDAFTAVINDILKYAADVFKEISPEVDGEALTVPEFPSLDGIKILGKEGITCEYLLSGNKIKELTENWDICLSIADIYTKVTGEQWDYQFGGDISITFDTKAEVSKIGSTRVSLPALTDENSFNLFEMFGDTYNMYDIDYSGYESEPYISSYVWGETATDTFDGERYYMPVRMCIEDAYYEYSDITYENGVVTIVTNTGIEGRDINASFRVGSDTATVNGITYDNLGTFRMIDGSVYAGVDFYEKCLGWTLEYLQKDLLDGYLSYEFYTSEYEEYFE